MRDALKVKPGDKVRHVILDEGVLMMSVRPNGSLKYGGPAKTLEDMERGIAEGALDAA